MAKIPGVPTIDPVNLPNASPAEFGRMGESFAQLGETVEGVAQQQQELNLFKKKAQEHVDVLASQNDQNALVLNFKETLAKTPNSQDVPEVVEQYNKKLNDLSARWSKSPAAIAIQMNGDYLRPELDHVGNVRQISLMGDELKITLDKQAETLAGDYAAGNREAALAALTAAVDGPAGKLLLGAAERGEYLRQLKIKGQTLEINNGIANRNPDVNQQVYENINAHPELYPDVTKEKLDVMKGQALDAFEAHTKFQEWADVQMAMKTLPTKVNEFTNLGTGHFDEAKALTDNAKRMASGEITDKQADALARGFESHSAQLRVQVKQDSDKKLDHIDNLLTAHEFGEAQAQMLKDEQWFEDNGLGDEYRQGMRYRNQMLSQTSAEFNTHRQMSIYERQEKERQTAYESDQVYGKVRLDVASGKVLEPLDIWKMPGLSDKDRTALLQEVKPENRDPHVTDGLNKISNLGITDERKYELARVFVNQVKSGDARGAAITDTADKLIKEVKSKNAQEYIDQLYRQTSEGAPPSTSTDAFRQFTHHPGSDAPAGLKPVSERKVNDVMKFPNGTTGVWDGHGWVIH